MIEIANMNQMLFLWLPDNHTRELMEDIRISGLKVPVKVHKTIHADYVIYRVEDGNHRCTSIALLGLKEIQVNVITVTHI